MSIDLPREFLILNFLKLFICLFLYPNAVQFMNTLLSDLTQERAIRSELDERVTLIKVENEELKKDCEKLKALINDLLHHPQVPIHLYLLVLWQTKVFTGSCIALL